MATSFAFKDILDPPFWAPRCPLLVATSAGSSLASDLRATEDRIPLIWSFTSAGALHAYNAKNDGWCFAANPNMSSSGAGGACVVAPARGPRGTLAAGGTTTTVTLATPLPAAVGVNVLANRGDGIGHKIRVLTSSAGSAGKTEERIIVASTGGTTPTLTLAPPLSAAPIAGDGYELLSGRVYILCPGTASPGVWKYYDIATGAMSANLAVTNLPAGIGTDSTLVVLDELYVPSSNSGGEGFLAGAGAGGVAGRALTATATSSTTLTGQASSGDAGVLASEYRNFQLRIVADATTPTSVGQRRKIVAHTAGASPVYTVAAWAVTPSSNAQYVIENSNEILMWGSASAPTYTYVSDTVVGGQAADSWSATTYASRGAATGAGLMAFQPFGMALDAQKGARYSQILAFRGGNAPTLDILDLAGSATGTWSLAVAYGGANQQAFNLGSCLAYDPVTAFAYINVNATQQMMRFDGLHRTMECWSQINYGPVGTASVGGRMAVVPFVDGAFKAPMIFLAQSSSSNFFTCVGSR